MKEKLYLIINTLNQIDVRGSGNLDKLLGSIQALEKLLHDLEANDTVRKEEKANG